MRQLFEFTCLTVAILLVQTVVVGADDAKPVTYDEHVAAILKRHCLQCHGETKQEAGLNLSSYLLVKKGGSGGPVVVAGRSSVSRIVEVITAEDPDERMPPDNDPLPKDQIAMIRNWIDSGLRQNSGSAAVAMRTLSFTPSPVSSGADGPPPMPKGLPNIERAKTVRPFPVLALATSPRAALAVFASYESIDFIDPVTRSNLGAIAFPEGEPHVLQFSRSGRALLVAGGRPVQNGIVALFDVTSGTRLATIGDEADTVIAADLSTDERRVAIGGTSRAVKIFSTEDGKLLHTLKKHTDWITALAFSPDGKLLATGDRIGNIHLWDAVSGGVVLPLSEHHGAIRALTWRSDSRVLASCGEDGLIVWWDVKDGWPTISKPSAHPPKRPPGVYGKIANGVLDAAFGPTGELVTCGRDNEVRLWADDGQQRTTYSIDRDFPDDQTPPVGIRIVPTRVRMTFDGATVIAGDSAGRIHSWPVER